MQYEFFTVPVGNSSDARDGLNRFLRTRRVLNVKTEFVSHGENSYWALAVEFLQGEPAVKKMPSTRKPKIDYREVLSEPDFILYSRLRDLRKAVAESEAIPVYAVFTNEQLAEMVRKKVKSKADVSKIEGIGQVKIDKYADRFLKIVNPVSDETRK